MLTVKNKDQYDSYTQLSDDVLNYDQCANLLEVMIDIVTKARAEREGKDEYLDPILTHKERYNALGKATALQLMKYTRGDRKYEFELPIFMDLQGLDVAKAATEAENYVPQPTVADSKLTKLVYNPMLMFAAGLISFISVVNLIPSTYVGMFMPEVFHLAPLPLKLLALFGSISYFVPFVFWKVKANMHKLLADTLDDINQGKLDAAEDKLTKLSISHRVLVWGGLPYVSDVKWNYFYVKNLWADGLGYNGWDSGYDAALDYAETAEQKFLPLRGLINYSYRRKVGLEHANLRLVPDHPVDAEEIAMNKRNILSYENSIRKYLAQLPLCPNLHSYFTEDISVRLGQCLAELTSSDDDTLKNGVDKFYDLNFDGYTMHFCPAMAVLYLQAYVRVILLTELLRSDRATELNTYAGFKFARNLMNMIQKILVEHFPDKVQEHNDYVQKYDYTLKQMLEVFSREAKEKRSAKEAALLFRKVEKEEQEEEVRVDHGVEHDPDLQQAKESSSGVTNKFVCE